MAATMNSTSYQSGYCMTSAAACTSARIHKIMDTAVLAVSILVLLFAILLKM